MSIKAEKSFSLADQLFNKETVTQLSRALQSADPGFDAGPFEDTAYAATVLGGVGVMQLVALFGSEPPAVTPRPDVADAVPEPVS